MKRMTGWLLGAAVAAWALTTAPTVAEEADGPSNKEIMIKAHKGANSLLSTIAKDLKGQPVDWDSVSTKAKELATLGAALEKNEPAKGEKASWEKLTKAYNVSAKALVTSSEKKDPKGAMAAQKKLSASCGSCHKVHK